MITDSQQINRMIWRTRRGARELDGLLMAYASERAAGWGDQQIATFEHLLAQPDPVLLDWFLRRTQPGDEELKLLVDEILATRTGASVLEEKINPWAQDATPCPASAQERGKESPE